MKETTKENLKVLTVGIIGYIIATLLNGCTTTSIYGCEKYIGIEKEMCIEDYNNRTNNLYRQKHPNFYEFEERIIR